MTANLAGLILMQSVHAVDDDTARHLRRAAVQAGATIHDLAEAIRLRDEYHAGCPTVLYTSDGMAAS